LLDWANSPCCVVFGFVRHEGGHRFGEWIAVLGNEFADPTSIVSQFLPDLGLLSRLERSYQRRFSNA
jgi:hypothetical protein